MRPTDSDLRLWRRVRPVLFATARVSAAVTTDDRSLAMTELGRAVINLGVPSTTRLQDLAERSFDDVSAALVDCLARVPSPLHPRDTAGQAIVCWGLYVTEGLSVGATGRRVGLASNGFIEVDWRAREKTAAERMWRSDLAGDYTVSAWPGIRVVVDAVLASLGLARDLPPPPSEGSASNERPFPGDASEFIADVTVPDGTAFDPNETFQKVWRIRNAGKVRWQDRWLRRLGSASGPGTHWSLPRVRIPDTAPGEAVEIVVEMRAARLGGTSASEWKMADVSDRLFFPDRYRYGLRCEITTRGSH